MCVGVTLWYGCGDVVSVWRLNTRTSKGDYTKPQQSYGTIKHAKKNG